MEDLSVITCTSNRPGKLRRLLLSILSQVVLPMQVIVWDDGSSGDETRHVVDDLNLEFSNKHVQLQYMRNRRQEGLTFTRNLAVPFAKGNLILFLDDDVILEPGYIKAIGQVFRINANAIGVQGYWPQAVDNALVRAAKIVFDISSARDDDCRVLSSMENVYPRRVAGPINCEWLQGNNMSYRKTVFESYRFDWKLKKPPSAEDVDFSFRISCDHPASLFLIPEAKLQHEVTHLGRSGWRTRSRRLSVYRTYQVFKFRRRAKLSLMSFMWNRIGWLVLHAGAIITGRGSLGRRDHSLALWELSLSYLYTLRHLASIIRQEMSFFSYA